MPGFTFREDAHWDDPAEKPKQDEGDESSPNEKSPDDDIIEKTLPTKPPGQKESE